MKGELDISMSKGHHLILGTTTDYITGETITDTDDERFRQKIARFLVEKKGYSKKDIIPKVRHDMSCGDLRGHSITDIVVRLKQRMVMIIKYGPGSLVTRERPALATARTITPSYTVPIAVVTNGRDAEILDVASGKIINTNMDKIPSNEMLLSEFKHLNFDVLPEKQLEAERRILMAYEAIEHSCGCTENWCTEKTP